MEYLPNLAHDVRTSMGEIIGLANLGLNAAGDTVRTRDCLLKIRSASEHLMSQLNDIMEMNSDGKMDQFYESFRGNMLSVLGYLAGDSGSLNKDACMVSNICIAIGHKMYLELYFSEMKLQMDESASK